MKLHEEFGDRAEFVFVYIREAHPTDGWSVESSGWSIRRDAQDLEERVEAAGQACAVLGLPFLTLVDDMDDEVARTWSAWPERLFVVSADGRVVYVGEQGPWGFWPRAAVAPYGHGEDHGQRHGTPLDEFLEVFLQE